MDNFNEAARDWKYVPSEARTALAHQFVYWAYINQPTTLTKEQQRLKTLLISDGYMRAVTLENAATGKLSENLLFNSTMIKGARAALLQEEGNFVKPDLVYNLKG